jgi:hypothetical protein
MAKRLFGVTADPTLNRMRARILDMTLLHVIRNPILLGSGTSMFEAVAVANRASWQQIQSASAVAGR